MLKHILVNVRPNPETSWYSVSEEFNLFREENFISTGKIISREEILSDDQIVRVLTTVFLDVETHKEFQAATATVEMNRVRGVYNKENKISSRGEVQII